MIVTNQILDGFTAAIMAIDKDARLSAKTRFWQGESSLRPLHKLLSHSVDVQSDVPWADVDKLIKAIPSDKKVKYKTALDVVEAKKAKWDFFANRVSGFGKFAAPDFREDVTIPGRGAPLTVIGEGLAAGEMHEIINNLKLLGPILHALAANKDAGPRSKWFPAASLDEVHTAVGNFDKYLNQRCSRLTFKRLHVGMRCDSDVNDPDDLVSKNLAGQVIPTVMLKGQDRPDFRKEGGYFSVPTGMRIFLGPLYFKVKNGYDAILTTAAIYRFMTLAHELSHKVLKTTDQVYELDACLGIANTPKAVMCADSWGYFITEYWKSPAYLMRTSAQSRRAAMGYDS